MESGRGASRGGESNAVADKEGFHLALSEPVSEGIGTLSVLPFSTINSNRFFIMCVTSAIRREIVWNVGIFLL